MPLCGMRLPWVETLWEVLPAAPKSHGEVTNRCLGASAALTPFEDTMPLQRIDLSTARSPELRVRVADAVHRALVEAISVPAEDRFQVVTAHPAGELGFPKSYLGISHQDPVLVQVTLTRGRTTEQKQALYRRMAELVQEAGVPANELVVSLVEAGREDWSFGNGIAQYVPEQ
jgi:4-oxalocrotonate tautomerase